MNALPAIERGNEAAEPVVLLHGFGGSARVWGPVQDELSDVHTIALDLPGHGAAVEYPDATRTVTARNAVLAEIERRGFERVHLVGHSRGGAIACLVAMKAPERVASLTLAAPGGFGPDIAADDLAAFAAARDEGELREAMGRLYAPRRPSRRVIAEQLERRTPEAIETMIVMRAGMVDEAGRQHALDLSLIEAADYPVTIVWGEADAVLPVAQADAIARARNVILPQVGHMLPDEAPRTLADAIRANLHT